MRLLLVASLIILTASCSSENSWSEMDVYKMAVAEDPAVELILPKDLDSGIQCGNYTDGCLRGKMARVRKVILTVVEFETEAQAREAAFQIDQYYARNWVFDEVSGEPVLESFVTKVYGAKRPVLEEKKLNKDK